MHTSIFTVLVALLWPALLLAETSAPLAARLKVLRRLAKQDPSSPIWRDDIESFEHARQAEIQAEIARAKKKRDVDQLRTLTEEVEGDWSTSLPKAGCRATSSSAMPAIAKISPLLLFLVIFCGCATYHIGNASLYPQEVHTVYVPMFESVSFRRDLGERLTEAVMKQIEEKTPYKVVSDPNADSVLSGRIIQESKRVTIGARTGDPRELQTQITVLVSWIDNRGKMLRPCPPIPLPPALTDVQGTGNLVPEVGQSLAVAQQDAINRLAEQIVGLMEKPW
jgi:hypothetical protein